MSTPKRTPAIDRICGDWGEITVTHPDGSVDGPKTPVMKARRVAKSAVPVMRAYVQKAEWDESAHPREKGGQFAGGTSPRNGQVLGHTGSGKEVHEGNVVGGIKGFTAHDHEDAAHLRRMNNAKSLSSIKAQRVINSPESATRVSELKSKIEQQTKLERQHMNAAARLHDANGTKPSTHEQAQGRVISMRQQRGERVGMQKSGTPLKGIPAESPSLAGGHPG